MNQPDPKLHMLISFAKSACRIIAAILLGVSVFKSAGIMFLIAEFLGILEELV